MILILNDRRLPPRSFWKASSSEPISFLGAPTRQRLLSPLVSCLVIVQASLVAFAYQSPQANIAGTIYYVDSADGSDFNNGTSSATPWQTIAKVNTSTFNPGDSILFKAGDTWREQLTAPSSGSPGNPITFGAYGTGNKPLFLGSTQISSWNLDSGNVYLTSGITWIANMAFEDGTFLHPAASRGAMTPGTFYFSAPAQVLYMWTTDGSNPASHTMEISSNTAAPYGLIQDGWFGHSYLVFDGLEVRYANWAAFRIYGGQHITVQNCTISYVYDNALVAVGTPQAAPANPDGLVARGNTISNTGFYRSEGGAGASGAEAIAVDSPNGFSIANNSIDTSYGEGIAIANAAQNGEVACNDINSQQISGGIYLAGSNGLTMQNITVRWNRIRTGTVSSAIIALVVAVEGRGAISNIDVAYNLVYDWPSGYGIGVGNGAGAISAVRVFGNTIDNVNYGLLLEGNSTTTNNLFENNIVSANADGLLVTSGSSVANVFDYNLYYVNDNVYPFNWWGTSYNLADLEANTGQESHSIYADPKFTNAAAFDLTLQPSSPAIDAGVNLGSAYQLGLSPASTWPSNVLTLNQKSFTSGWGIGAYVYPQTTRPPSRAPRRRKAQ
jgi:hypothetical protein